MRGIVVISAAFSLLLLSGIAGAAPQEEAGKARWSAELSASGGTNFQGNPSGLDPDRFANSKGEMNLKIGVAKNKYSIQSGFQYGKSFNSTNQEGITYNLKDDVRNAGVDEAAAGKSNTKLQSFIGTDFFFSNSDKVNAKFTWTGNWDEAGSGLISTKFPVEEDLEFYTFQYTEESSDFKKDNYLLEAGWDHKFASPFKTLKVTASRNIVRDSRSTEWEIGSLVSNLEDDPDPTPEKQYMITPLYIDRNTDVKAVYRDTRLAGVDRLDLEASLRLFHGNDDDNYSASTLKEGHWEDSLSYRASYDYHRLIIEPSLRVRYSTGPFAFDLGAVPQYFTDRLNSVYQGIPYSERYDKGAIHPLLNFRFDYKPSNTHNLSLRLERTIKMADYLQMCWFRRPSTYTNELQEGNPDLDPAESNTARLAYTFTFKRFSATLEAGDVYDWGKIERTFRKETIEGKEFRVYTYINAGHSNTANARLALNWKGERLSATLEGDLKGFVGYANNGNESRSSDYSLKADLKYNWKHGFSTEAHARYNSPVRRTYSYITEYVSCDVRVAKKFGRLELFLDGRDLFDSEIERETYSDDLLEGRIETQNNYRRIILLGLKFNL